MAQDSFGAKNQPQYAGTGTPADAADLSQISNYAANVGNRKVGTDSARLALAGADLWVGLLFGATDTGVEWVYLSGGWTARSAKIQPASSVGLTASFVSSCQLTLPPGTWLIHALACAEYSTGALRTYQSDLYNLTAATELYLGESFVQTSLNGNTTMPIVWLATFTVSTTIQLRSLTGTTDGTQFISTRSILAAVMA